MNPAITQNISDFLNHLISQSWIFALLGLGHLILTEYKLLFQFFKGKSKKIAELKPVLIRAGYLVLGLLIISGAYSFTTLISSLMEGGIGPVMNIETLQVENFWSWIKFQSGSSGLIATVGFVLSGMSLTLSAGGRWLVNLAKLLATVSVLYLVLVGFVLAA